MTIEERIAKLKTSLAEKCRSEYATCPPWHPKVDYPGVAHGFVAGADALAEVYRLQGKLAAMDQFYEVGGVGGAAHSLSVSYGLELEALLKQEEKV